MKQTIVTALAILSWGQFAAGAAVAEGKPFSALPSPRKIDFDRDIQPVFAAKCYSCHGPEKQKSGLRLDTPERAMAGGDTGKAIVPGKSSKSLLYRYIAGLDPEIKMPPKGERLSRDEIAAIRTWIDEGALWNAQTAAATPKSRHWSFIQPVHSSPPRVRNARWVRNPIDAFVLAKLEAARIAPSPEADRPTLIRRLSLDLIGLPPTPGQVNAFVNDRRDDAYERLVDALLLSPHFGERWGRHWLDLARYADSEGYQVDKARPWAYVYRNWVIDAFNRDLPFDQFTIEQLAGDLLPNATQEQRIAAGFHRNTLMNHEDGVDREEFRCKAKSDRVATTGIAWLGLTLGCAECHTHKYDPITQKEFFAMYSFFNNAEEVDFPAPQRGEGEIYAQRRKDWDEENNRIKTLLADFSRRQLSINQSNWERSLALPLTHWIVLEATNTLAEGSTLRTERDKTVKTVGRVPASDTYVIETAADLKGVTGFRLEVLPAPGRKGLRNKQGRFALSEFSVELQRPGCKARRIVLQNATADLSLPSAPVEQAIDGIPTNGWSAGDPSRRHAAIFETREDVDCTGGAKLVFKLVQQSGFQMTIGRFKLSATTSPRPHHASLLPDAVSQILETAATKRNAKQSEELARYYREEVDPFSVSLTARLQQLTKTAPQFQDAQAQGFRQATNYVKTFVHVRGDFLRQGEEVRPGVLSALHPFKPRSATPDRLDLAQWLVDRANPLTARVAVNQIWQHLFGRGLVSTPDDFGVRGERPSHPELLDWLATEFMDRGWSRKEMIRLIVSSATYRQSANERSELTSIDSNNALLARQNRFRLESEIIRDSYLACGGILNQDIKGPSFHPPVPDEFKALGGAGAFTWVDSEGLEKYRRGLYVFTQRTVPYPVSMTFDSANPSETCPRRESSNTPLQALTLLNNPTFFEGTQGLARRMLLSNARTPEERIARGFELCLARKPSRPELSRLARLFEEGQRLAAIDRRQVAAIMGNFEMDARDLEDAAGFVLVAQVIMNLEEFLTRE